MHERSRGKGQKIQKLHPFIEHPENLEFVLDSIGTTARMGRGH